MKYFDRHKSMSTQTFQQIGLILKHGKITSQLENYIYGLYDGYNYSEEILQLAEIQELEVIDPEILASILEVLRDVDTYTEL